jgi:phosphoribosylformylglycinamidine synthase
VLILRAAGTNCDLETQHAWELAGATAERVHVRRLIAEPALLDQCQVLTLPGGFSYGDDIAAGRILAAQLRRHLLDAISCFVDAGKLVLGICNGFQVLVQLGLLPVREVADRRTCTITYNEPPGFQDRWVTLAADTQRCAFLKQGRRYEMPIAHGEGRVVFSDAAGLDRVLAGGHRALRYVEPGVTGGSRESGGTGGLPTSAGVQQRSTADSSGATGGSPTSADAQQRSTAGTETGRYEGPANPNGSEGDIAGLCDETGRVLGLMPHPERFVTRTQHPCWTARPGDEAGDGLALFRRAVAFLT